MALDPIREQAWPWPGGVLVKEQHADQEQIHLINQWCWLGSAKNEGELYDLLEHASSDHQIELDVYKILVKFLLQPSRKLEVRPL